MIEIYDDLFSKELSDKIENFVLNDNFAWFFNSVSTATNLLNIKSKNVKEYIMFTHKFYDWDWDKKETYQNSPHDDLVLDFEKVIRPGLKIKNFNLMRFKANFLPKSNMKKDNYNLPHQDFPNIKTKVLLYYVNDSDGDTFFFDNPDKLNIIKRVSPKKGRLVHFDGHLIHASTHPSKSDKRVVFNINYYDRTQF